MAAAYLIPERPVAQLAEHVAGGGGAGLARARSIGPDAVRADVRAAGLRGRDAVGGDVAAGWAAVCAAPAEAGPRYLVAIGTDSEPGSFVDRALLRVNPYAVLEGLVIAALAIGARDAFVVIRRSFAREYEILADAIADAELAGWLDDVSVKAVRAPDEYLSGEPRAALEVIEGRPPLPRRGAPHVDGLFGAERADTPDPGRHRPANPTVVESLETLANLGPILREGPAWFRSRGTAISPGHLLITVTGDVRRHRVAEVELGRPLVDVLDEVGDGFLPSAPAKAVLNGVSSPVLTRNRLGSPLSWEGLAAAGASLGRAAFQVFGEGTDMVGLAHGIASFLYVESCGWCPPCKFGGGEVTAHLARLQAGVGRIGDIETVLARLAGIVDGRQCELAAQHRDVVASVIRAFPGDFAAAVQDGYRGTPVPVRGLADLVAGRAEWDDRQAHKRPDWVVEEQPVQLTRW